MPQPVDLTDLIHRATAGDAEATVCLRPRTTTCADWLARGFHRRTQHRARHRIARTDRRGGDAARVPLTTSVADRRLEAADEILRVHQALDAIAALDARMAQVVELRYFAGLTEPEIAEVLGVTDRTVRRDWEKARLLLREALQ